MKRATAWTILFLLSAAMPAGASARRLNDLPAPRVLAPHDEVELGDGVMFRWTNEGGTRDYYDFRLYKGPQAIESAIILKEKVSPRDQHFKVPADKFEKGGTYSWAVRQVGSRKSRPSYAVFTVAA